MKDLKKQKVFMLLAGLVIVGIVALSSQFSAENLQGKLTIKSPHLPTTNQEPLKFGFNKPLTVEPPVQSNPVNRANLAKAIVDKKGVILPAGVYVNCAPDVQSGSWYEPYVCFMVANNIMSVYPNGEFQPMNMVNRAEAAKVFAASFFSGKVYQPKQWYLDVSLNDWFFDYVNTLATEKVLDTPAIIDQDGDPHSFFQPGIFMTDKAVQNWASKIK